MGSSPLSDLAIAGSNNRGRMDNRAMNLFRSGTRNRITSTPLITAPLRCSSFLCMRVAVALALSGLSVTGRGQLPPPPPDGGYPGNNTAEGASALFSNSTGTDNTAIGNSALTNNTGGSLNTAIGVFALFTNSTGLATRPLELMRSLTIRWAAATRRLAFRHWIATPLGKQHGQRRECAFFNTTGFNNTEKVSKRS